MSYNLNNCNGRILINNDNNITLPPVNKTNSYEINFEEPCFFINNHYVTPLLKCYNVVLPNSVSLETNDCLRLKIKIPKQIFGLKYGYNLDNFVSELQKPESKFCMGLNLKSSDNCLNLMKEYGDELKIEDFCGWITITVEHKLIENLCNLCKISYSINFNPVKVKTLYGVCDKHDDEVVDFKTTICLELDNNSNMST